MISPAGRNDDSRARLRCARNDGGGRVVLPSYIIRDSTCSCLRLVYWQNSSTLTNSFWSLLGSFLMFCIILMLWRYLFPVMRSRFLGYIPALVPLVITYPLFLFYLCYLQTLFILYLFYRPFFRVPQPYTIHTLSILYLYSIHTLSILYLYSIQCFGIPERFRCAHYLPQVGDSNQQPAAVLGGL